MSKCLVICLCFALCAVAGLGCGSGGSSTSSTTTLGTTESSSATEPPSGEPSREFVKKGGKNEIPTFGTEASAAEREAVSEVVEKSLTARAAGDWAGQCATLSSNAIKTIKETVPPREAGSCAEALKLEAQPVVQTRSIRANTMTEPIAALRVKGNKAYALYHGAKGQNYAMPVEKEGGAWKVSALVTVTP
jgi:hypothetical protein